MKTTKKTKFVLTLVLVVFSQISSSQIIIDKGIYKVNFSNFHRAPLTVTYKLYRGGGSCTRSGMTFSNDIKKITTATNKDYYSSGFDKGHLASAEDFANDCNNMALTFRYYNCIPQRPNLNRGLWAQNEKTIRKWSQNDSLLIVCGAIYDSIRMKNVSVPRYCFKIVQSLKSKKVLFSGLFLNSDKATVKIMSVYELELLTKSKIKLKE